MNTLRIPIELLEKLEIGQKLIIENKNNNIWIQDIGTSQPHLTQPQQLDLFTELPTR